MKQWFENDSFWQDTYPFMFPEKRFAETEEQIDKLLKLIDFRGSTVLDLCCGPGRCSIALAKRHYQVTGVDRTPFLLDKAKQKANNEDIEIDWVLEDMRDFVRAERFDLILSTFTSFGYFDDKNEDILVLENMFHNLKPGGICLIDLMAKETLAKVFQNTISESSADGTMIVQQHKIYDDWTRIKNQWFLIKDDKVKRFQFDLNIYSGQELKERLQKVGFDDIKLYGNLDGAPFDDKAQRLVITGQKPER